MQTILEARGTIGVELVKALTDCTNQIRWASQNPAKNGKEFNITPTSYAEEIKQIIQNDYSKIT
ncbi:hypothetical protein [Maribellus sp. YY47]|uniref:hypothetical protein n=1 Tax=Maribellus sp. YY47 TaxID=2929486 RepID=UPI0020006892|nr:hypothetical protein [Maribellus sp. YY47]MCK3684167.1 hypothetical protein [Maribellus sp. YY47]